MKRHRRLLVVLGVVVVVLVAGGVTVWILWHRSSARPVTREEAIQRFHPLRGTNGGPVRPPQGVYAYRGTGHEALSLPPKSQPQGPTIPVTVTWRTDGCWVFRVDYSTNHWQTWIYCPRSEGLVELGGQTFQHWDLVFTQVRSTSTFTCDPPSITIKPAMRPGDLWQQSCSGTSNTTKGRVTSQGLYRFVGEETVTVAGQAQRAFRFHQSRTLTGAQQGTQTADIWFRASDGLPLRNERDVTVRTDSVVGTVTYTEEGSFEIASLLTVG